VLKAVLDQLLDGLEQCTRKANLAKGIALIAQMRKGSQEVADFSDRGALWGYTKYKFFSRAVCAFELFRSAAAVAEATGHIRWQDNPLIVSIGGGPANDIYGYILFLALTEQVTHPNPMAKASDDDAGLAGGKPTHTVAMDADSTAAHKSNDGGTNCHAENCLYSEVADPPTTAAAATTATVTPFTPPLANLPSMVVMDFAPEWKHIVDAVAAASNTPIGFEVCDVRMPLTAAKNEALQQASTHVGVYLFCYV
jgi:hypothetical protein